MATYVIIHVFKNFSLLNHVECKLYCN